MTDRLHGLEVFVAVVDAGSFVGGARKLCISPPAVTRAVASLEERLGVRLVTRTTRRLALTEAGLRFLEHARRLLADLEAAEREASGETAAPAGHLSVTAPATFGRSVLAPVVSAFLRDHPPVTASLMLVDRVVNVVEEGIDVAARIGNLPDSSLVARRVGEVQRVLVASPAYLRSQGEPAEPEDLKRHAIIAFTGLMPSREWRFVDGAARPQVVVRPRLAIDDASAAIEACEAGDGITVAVSYMVADRIAAGRLVPVLGQYAPPPIPVQLVYPHSRLLAPKIRAFLDFAAPRLAEYLGRLPPICDPRRKRRRNIARRGP